MDTDLLAALIDRKAEILARLLSLARRQRDAVGQAEVAQLLGVLAAKQQWLNGLQDVERQLAPFRHQDPERRRWRSPEDRRRARESAERCEALLREIVLLERECESELIRRRDAAARRLQGIHAGAQAGQAYSAIPLPRGGQLDVSSES